eukprot:TRINITY_DN3593_c1_g3_i2.p1 TRINITY_DN3593_c1_g3~~TRINITY_DN3593_c1_g3_i2.p1  ORF type:complete len:748 (+),score=204.06 TRINITY_DN3593_c1_g3_i2:92-2335(+)
MKFIPLRDQLVRWIVGHQTLGIEVPIFLSPIAVDAIRDSTREIEVFALAERIPVSLSFEWNPTESSFPVFYSIDMKVENPNSGVEDLEIDSPPDPFTVVEDACAFTTDWVSETLSKHPVLPIAAVLTKFVQELKEMRYQESIIDDMMDESLLARSSSLGRTSSFSMHAFIPETSKLATKLLAEQWRLFKKRDLKGPPLPFSCRLIDDNLYRWEVTYHDLGVPCELQEQLNQYKASTGQDGIVIRLVFPPEYDALPPFVRVVRPRMDEFSSTIAHGGLICLPVLQQDLWESKGRKAPLIDMIKVIGDSLARSGTRIHRDVLQSGLSRPYMEEEAMASANRTMRASSSMYDCPHGHSESFFALSYSCAGIRQNVMGDRMYLSSSFLDAMQRGEIEFEFPLLFELSGAGFRTYCGVADFSTPPGCVLVPPGVMHDLHLMEGSEVFLRYVSLPMAKGIKVLPLSDTFHELDNPLMALTHGMEKYTTVMKGDRLSILDSGKVYDFSVLSLDTHDWHHGKSKLNAGSLTTGSFDVVELRVEFAPFPKHHEKPAQAAEKTSKAPLPRCLDDRSGDVVATINQQCEKGTLILTISQPGRMFQPRLLPSMFNTSSGLCHVKKDGENVRVEIEMSLVEARKCLEIFKRKGTILGSEVDVLNVEVMRHDGNMDVNPPHVQEITSLKGERSRDDIQQQCRFCFMNVPADACVEHESQCQFDVIHCPMCEQDIARCDAKAHGFIALYDDWVSHRCVFSDE